MSTGKSPMVILKTILKSASLVHPLPHGFALLGGIRTMAHTQIKVPGKAIAACYPESSGASVILLTLPPSGSQMRYFLMQPKR